MRSRKSLQIVHACYFFCVYDHVNTCSTSEMVSSTYCKQQQHLTSVCIPVIGSDMALCMCQIVFCVGTGVCSLCCFSETLIRAGTGDGLVNGAYCIVYSADRDILNQIVDAYKGMHTRNQNSFTCAKDTLPQHH